jgi:hypothetical protein
VAKQYTQVLKCPECGRVGEVEFEDGPLQYPGAQHSGRATKIVTLPPGFEKGQRQDDVVCSACEALIPR